MAEGRVVADRYLLHEQVGKGGMGVVGRADDQVLGRPVAVKEVHLQPGLPADEREGPLPAEAVAGIGLAVLDVLAAAHATGIVHRDLKPGNVLVSGDSVKLTDFGIAQIKDDPRLTSTGIVLGSPSYVSPEQALGKRASDETDLWGL